MLETYGMSLQISKVILMKKMAVFLIFLLAGMVSSAACAESAWYETTRSTALRVSPAGSAKMLTTLKKGTALHSTDKGHGEWVEVYEMAGNAKKAENGEQAYIYRLYNLPGTNAFVLKRDLKVIPLR